MNGIQQCVYIVGKSVRRSVIGLLGGQCIELICRTLRESSISCCKTWAFWGGLALASLAPVQATIWEVVLEIMSTSHMLRARSDNVYLRDVIFPRRLPEPGASASKWKEKAARYWVGKPQPEDHVSATREHQDVVVSNGAPDLAPGLRSMNQHWAEEPVEEQGGHHEPKQLGDGYKMAKCWTRCSGHLLLLWRLWLKSVS